MTTTPHRLPLGAAPNTYAQFGKRGDAYSNVILMLELSASGSGES